MRYLMATITVAALFAYLNYVSTSRRLLFMLFAIVMAIVGNWLRAYGIVMIAHLSDMKLALGVDHYIYGWVFFGVIIFALMAIGRIWQEEPESPESQTKSTLSESSQESGDPQHIIIAVTLGGLLMVVWPTLGMQVTSGLKSSSYPLYFDSEDIPPTWKMSNGTLSDWTPEFQGESQLVTRTIETEYGKAGLFLAWYATQQQGSEVISAHNAWIQEKHERWRHKRLGVQLVKTGDGSRSVITGEMVSEDAKFLVWQWYWIGGNITTATSIAKIYQVISLLFGKGNSGASVIVYTPIDANDAAMAPRVLQDLVSVYGPVLERALDDAVRR
jgi:EpsI family protein